LKIIFLTNIINMKAILFFLMISFLEVKSDLPISCENKNEMIGNVWTFHLD
jgi:hypothetical protein